MAKLIILRGNSGSGKTALSKLLQEKFGPNTMRISHDMVRMEILHTWGREGVEKSEPLMIELLKYGRQHSEVTILEGILPSEAYQSLFETAVEDTARIFWPTITTCPLKRLCAGMPQSPIGTSSVKLICAAGGWKRISSRIFGKGFLERK